MDSDYRVKMSNVKVFGAIGDGVSDDTLSIQKAINEGDGVLEFPLGNYLITKTLEIKLSEHGRISIHGNGGVAKLIMAGPGPAISLVGTHAASADPNDFLPEEWQKERMPTISNIEIEGRHQDADGIHIEGIMQPTLSGLLIREVNTAIRIHKRARNVLIDRCHIYHNKKIGIHLDRLNLHQINITGSHISYNCLGGIRVEESEIRNLQITGNDIEYNNNRTHGADNEIIPTAEIYIDTTKGTVREGTIASNTIQATYSAGGSNIRFIGRSPEENINVGLFSITGNLIGTQENNIHLTAACAVAIVGNLIYGGFNRNILIEASRNISIGSNVFDHPGYQQKNELCTGIRIVDSVNCNITGLVLQDCKFERNITAAEPVSRTALLELLQCKRVNISGTQVIDAFPYGMYLKDCEDTVITGCSIIDAREPKRMLAPILWEGTGDGCMITCSRIKPGLEGSIVGAEGIYQASNLVG